MLGWWLGLTQTTGDELLTLIFTSGSTGKPKGVMLTHGNVASNVEAIDQVIHLSKDDVLLGILPLFHALGSTVTLWAGAILDLKVAYHFSPLDPKQVGKLAKEHDATVLLTTPTFLRSYTRRCEVEEFAKLKTVITGAERLPDDVPRPTKKNLACGPSRDTARRNSHRLRRSTFHRAARRAGFPPTARPAPWVNRSRAFVRRFSTRHGRGTRPESIGLALDRRGQCDARVLETR